MHNQGFDKKKVTSEIIKSVKKHLKMDHYTVLFLILTLFFGNCAFATVAEANYIKQGTKVYINYVTNHGYIERDVPFSLAHKARAIDLIRKDLVAQGKIEDIPMIVLLVSSVTGWTFSDRYQLLLLEDGRLSKGECVYRGNAWEEAFPCCYKIQSNEMNPSLGNLCALTVNLQNLKKLGEQLNINDVEKLHERYKALPPQYFDPIWSPNGEYVLVTVWNEEKTSFKVYERATRKSLSIKELNNELTARPIWSSDSRYFAVASLQEVVIHDVEKNKSRIIDLSPYVKDGNYETLVSFAVYPGKLTFTVDQNLFTWYDIYQVDLLNEQEEPVLAQARSHRPKWSKDIRKGMSDYPSRKSVISPNGKQVAYIVIKDDGTNELVIRRLATTEDGRPNGN